MKPEPGDPAVIVDARAVREGFQAAGAVQGDTLIYHGSLSSMGRVAGGPRTVIDGARLAVGPEGTVAMPTLWYHRTDPPMDPGQWSIATSASYVGALSEAIRTHPDSVRSDHFSHAVSAIGRRAVQLVADHGAGGLRPSPWGPRAFARLSPWARLVEWDALYCFVGVTFRVLTLKHYMETTLVDEILQAVSPHRRRDLTGRLADLGRPGVWPSIDGEHLEAHLERLGLVAHARIGSATVRAIRTRQLVDTGMALLRDRPEHWFSAPFLAWRRDALGP